MYKQITSESERYLRHPQGSRYTYHSSVFNAFAKSVCNPMVLSSTQLQNVSVTLWFRRLHCLVLYYVLFCLLLSTYALQVVCVHTMDFVSGH